MSWFAGDRPVKKEVRTSQSRRENDPWIGRWDDELWTVCGMVRAFPFPSLAGLPLEALGKANQASERAFPYWRIIRCQSDVEDGIVPGWARSGGTGLPVKRQIAGRRLTRVTGTVTDICMRRWRLKTRAAALTTSGWGHGTSGVPAEPTDRCGTASSAESLPVCFFF